MSQKTLGAANPAAAMCCCPDFPGHFDYWKFSLPCLWPFHSWSRSSLCRGTWENRKTQKVEERYGVISSSQKVPFKIVGGSYHITRLRQIHPPPLFKLTLFFRRCFEVWINQCVGSHNHRSFVLFLVGLTLLAWSYAMMLLRPQW